MQIGDTWKMAPPPKGTDGKNWPQPHGDVYPMKATDRLVDNVLISDARGKVKDHQHPDRFVVQWIEAEGRWKVVRLKLVDAQPEPHANEPQGRDLVVSRVENGWVVVERWSWDDINEQLDEIAAIRQCTTWGAFTALQVANPYFVELVHEVMGVDGAVTPEADEPFDVDLSSFEDFDRDRWLMLAMMDLIESLANERFPYEHVIVLDTTAFIPLDQKDTVIRLLEAEGHDVEEVDQ